MLFKVIKGRHRLSVSDDNLLKNGGWRNILFISKRQKFERHEPNGNHPHREPDSELGDEKRKAWVYGKQGDKRNRCQVMLSLVNKEELYAIKTLIIGSQGR